MNVDSLFFFFVFLFVCARKHTNERERKKKKKKAKSDHRKTHLAMHCRENEVFDNFFFFTAKKKS